MGVKSHFDKAFFKILKSIKFGALRLFARLNLVRFKANKYRLLALKGLENGLFGAIRIYSVGV